MSKKDNKHPDSKGANNAHDKSMLKNQNNIKQQPKRQKVISRG